MKYLYIVIYVYIFSYFYTCKQNSTEYEIIDYPLNVQMISKKNYKTDRPIIGLLSQPSSWKKLFEMDEYSYIATSYVQYIESAGGRVVPIKYDADLETLKTLFYQINGLLIPGGASDLIKSQNQLLQELLSKQNGTFQKSQQEENLIEELEFTDQQLLADKESFLNHPKWTNFTKAGAFLIQLAIESNDKGDYFPVWGTCLGFELLILTISKNSTVFGSFNSTNHSMNLKFVNNERSKMFEDMHKKTKNYLENFNSSYFNHNFGISNQSFYENQNLVDFFQVNSFNYDKNNNLFISSIESKKYPIYGTQFHPEKNIYEFKDKLQLSHSQGSIESSHYFSYFFLDECRKNSHTFKLQQDETEKLIYNFYPIKVSNGFQSVYIFSQFGHMDIFRATIKIKRKHQLSDNTLIYQFDDNDDDIDYDQNVNKDVNKILSDILKQRQESISKYKQSKQFVMN